jgi:CRP/FNR family cyclic AMP-dependent transcriptional regulator
MQVIQKAKPGNGQTVAQTRTRVAQKEARHLAAALENPVKSVREDRFESDTMPEQAARLPWPLPSSRNGAGAMAEAGKSNRIMHAHPSPTDSMARGNKALFNQKSFNSRFGGVSVANYKPAQVVYAQDAAADSIFYVQHGKVKLTHAAKDGKQAVIAILGASDFCGTEYLSGQLSHVLCATAATECSIARLKKGAVRRAIDEDPSFARRIISHLSNRESRLQEDLADQLCNSSEQRLARLLILMADHGNSGWGKLLSPRIDQATLGNMVGTSRQRINFFLNKFRLAGHIARGDGIRVHASLQHVTRM